MKIKAIIAILAFGVSALAANASLVLNKIDASMDARGLRNYYLPSSLSLQAINPNQNARVESISDVPDHSTIFGVYELMAVSDAYERAAISDTREHVTISQVPVRATISDVRELMTVSQVPVRAKISQVPEPPTILAGELLLLPLGVSTVRMWRRKKAEQSKSLDT